MQQSAAAPPRARVASFAHCCTRGARRRRHITCRCVAGGLRLRIWTGIYAAGGGRTLAVQTHAPLPCPGTHAAYPSVPAHLAASACTTTNAGSNTPGLHAICCRKPAWQDADKDMPARDAAGQAYPWRAEKHCVLRAPACHCSRRHGFQNAVRLSSSRISQLSRSTWRTFIPCHLYLCYLPAPCLHTCLSTARTTAHYPAHAAYARARNRRCYRLRTWPLPARLTTTGRTGGRYGRGRWDSADSAGDGDDGRGWRARVVWAPSRAGDFMQPPPELSPAVFGQLTPPRAASNRCRWHILPAPHAHSASRASWQGRAETKHGSDAYAHRPPACPAIHVACLHWRFTFCHDNTHFHALPPLRYLSSASTAHLQALWRDDGQKALPRRFAPPAAWRAVWDVCALLNSTWAFSRHSDVDRTAWASRASRAFYGVLGTDGDIRHAHGVCGLLRRLPRRLHNVTRANRHTLAADH